MSSDTENDNQIRQTEALAQMKKINRKETCMRWRGSNHHGRTQGEFRIALWLFFKGHRLSSFLYAGVVANFISYNDQGLKLSQIVIFFMYMICKTYK